MSSIFPETVSVTPTTRLFWHEHPVDDLKGLITSSCEECDEKVGTMYKIVPYYRCSTCRTRWHHSCTPGSPADINHQSHPNHPLKLLLNGPPDYTDGKCSLCQRKLAKYLYHCELCNFSVDLGCVNNPPPLTIDQQKCHTHALTLMARDVSFNCNACGTRGERNPYVCPPCSLMFHRDCTELPHVININRHDHRVSHTYSLTHGNQKCGICRKKIDWRYGVYTCSKCPDYVVHPNCATHRDVWDGKELEGVLEETADVAPFKMIEAGVINHSSHKEHNLRLIEDDIVDCDESIRCVACTRPIYDEKHYKCTMECKFTLHETCANLPLQKRHGLSTKVFSLCFEELG